MDKAILVKIGQAIGMAALTVAVTTIQALSQEKLIDVTRNIIRKK